MQVVKVLFRNIRNNRYNCYNRNIRDNCDKQPFPSQFRHTMPPDVSDLPQIGG